MNTLTVVGVIVILALFVVPVLTSIRPGNQKKLKKG